MPAERSGSVRLIGMLMVFLAVASGCVQEDMVELMGQYFYLPMKSPVGVVESELGTAGPATGG